MTDLIQMLDKIIESRKEPNIGVFHRSTLASFGAKPQDHTIALAEMLKVAIEGLKAAAEREECRYSYSCCASCGPIYEAERALEQISQGLEGIK